MLFRLVSPDFKAFYFEKTGTASRRLFVQFEIKDGQPLKVPFEVLSDGEKSFFIASAVRALNVSKEPVFCFWDEPDNFLSLREVGFFVSSLSRDFSKRGQFMFTSHSGEAIASLGEEDTWLIRRNSHIEPALPPVTLETLRKNKELEGDLRWALLSGEVEA